MKFKETPAQNVALHTIQSVLLSALITLVVGIIQYVGLHGFDGTTLATFAAGSFLGQMSMVWKTLAGNPTMLQAALDTLTDIKGLAAQTPVIVHNNIPAAPQIQAAPASIQPAISTPTAQAIPAQPTQVLPLPQMNLPQRSFTSLETPIVQPTQQG